MTQLLASHRPDSRSGHSADRSELLRLLTETMVPDMPTLEAMLDLIERQDGRP